MAEAPTFPTYALQRFRHRYPHDFRDLHLDLRNQLRLGNGQRSRRFRNVTNREDLLCHKQHASPSSSSI